MSPSVAFLGGLLLVWIVASGRATAVWKAVISGSATPGTTTPGTVAPGLTPGVPPGSRDPYQPPTTG